MNKLVQLCAHLEIKVLEVKLVKRVVLLAISALYFAQLQAQIVTDRPDQTESSSTVGLGNLQIESGLLIAYEGDSLSSSRNLLAPTSLFRYGITKGIELRFLSQFETLKNETGTVQGISDLEIGTKIQVLQEENRNTEIAFLSHLVMPTGTTEISGDTFGTINKISIAHELGGNLGLGYNLGYNYLGEGNGDLTYSVALGVGVNDRVGLYIEPYGELQNCEDFLLNVDAGITYLANEDLQFDFSFGTGTEETMNYVSVGFSWLLKGEVN